MDQFVLTPCVLSLFFTCQSLLEGKGFTEAKRRIETSWWPTIQRNWSLWIPVQAVNFSVVPLQYRVSLPCYRTSRTPIQTDVCVTLRSSWS